MDRDIWSERQKVLCTLLRHLRAENKLTQVELAKKLRRPQTYVSKYERGDRRLDFFEIFDICQVCGITMIELVKRIELELEHMQHS